MIKQVKFLEAVMYGAGNIGRGFIGQLFSKSGYSVCFIDVNETVINALNKNKTYPVKVLLQEGCREEWVKDVSAVNGHDTEAAADKIARADIMATAVGVNVLPFIAGPIAAGIRRRYEINRSSLNIIICENLIGADEYLRDLIGKELPEKIRQWFFENVGLCEASIGRMVPIQTPEMQGDNPLRVCVEEYAALPVDKDAFKGSVPSIKNLQPFSPFSFFIERKLFVHNMGHALAAYIGGYYGDEYIWQTMSRPICELIVLRAMTCSAIALSKHYSFDLSELTDHINDLILRFKNKQLGDTCLRVGRDLRRKLSENDRIIGAIKTCKRAGVDTAFCCLCAAFALRFTKDELISEMTPEQVLSVISRLPQSEPEYDRILRMYQMLDISLPEKLYEDCCFNSV